MPSPRSLSTSPSTLYARPTEEFEFPLADDRRPYQPIVTLDGKTEQQDVRDSQAMLVIVLGLLGIVLLLGIAAFAPLTGAGQ